MSEYKGTLKTQSGDILYPQTTIDKVTGFPATSAGDLIYGGTGGALTTLSAGTNGQALKVSSGAPSWEADISQKTQSIFYAQVDSTSTSTNFTVTIPELTATEYYDGLTLLLYNGKVTSASGFTINVNGLGAKPSYSNMALGNPVTPTDPTRDTTIFNINYAMLFIYNSTRVSGGCWVCYRGYDANTNTIGYQVRTNNSTLKASDKFYRYRLLFTSADGTQWVPANTSTSTNATSARNVNQRPIDPFGEIVWYGTTTAIEANANVTAAQLWQQYYGTYTLIGYSFNNTGAAATMTANRPIYIKCTPQSNGSAIIDANTPYVQALPSTDDGKIYIFLGRAVSATAFEILLNHPVYYYKDGAIRVWTNPADSGMANPMTSLGDMIYGDAGADPIKLSIGTSGQVLTSDGSIPYWATPATPATVGTLDTTATTAQTTSASESFSSNITLHKVSKTGSYNDLNDKPTIPVDTNTTYTLNVSGTGDNANKVGLVAGGSGSGTTWYTIPYATNAGTASSANSVAWANVSGHADGVKTDIGIESSGTTFLRKDGTWATPTAGMSNPMTTKGDIIIGDTDGAPTRLAGSGTTKFLQSTGGSNGITLSWADIQGTTIKSGTTGSYATSGQVLTADGSGSASWTNIPSDIFVAIYGVTTYTDIVSAINAGKAAVAMVSDSGETSFAYLDMVDASQVSFRMASNYSVVVVTCSASDDSWDITTFPYSETEIYQPLYNVSTYTDIYTAASGGKLCVVEYQGDVYIMSNASAEGFIFSSASSNAIKTVYVDNQDTWGNQSYAFAAGTVTSVQVQAGTGLTSSQSTAQTTTLNTTIGIDSGYKLPTTTEWGKVVLTDTDQSIDGTKTFVERPLYPENVTLPSGYTQLEYIHSDGTAYIDTGRKYSTSDEIELVFQQDNTNNYRIWGTFNQSSYTGPNVSMTYSNGWCIRQETVSGQARLVELGAINTSKHTLKILSSGHCYFDGVDKGVSAGWAANYNFNYNAYLFTINPGGTTPTTTMVGRVYRYRVWRNGVIQQDMYPAKYVSGNTTTYGMYDITNAVFHSNAGSGSLTGGGTPTPSPMVFEGQLSQVAFTGKYTDLSGTPTNHVTTDTAQTITATKTFTAQQKFQSGSPGGCVVFGANVSATTVSAGTRKLARLTAPTYETNGSSVVGFLSVDMNAYSNGSGNSVEFGSRTGDSTSFGPDIISFSLATSHNNTQRNNVAQFLPTKVQLFNHASGSTSIVQNPATNLVGMWEFNNNNTFVNNTYTYTLPNATGTLMLNPMDNVGQMIYGDAAGNPQKISGGTSGQVLTVNSNSIPVWGSVTTTGISSGSASSGQVLTANGSGGVSWATPASGGMANPMTTQGDIIYGGSSGTPTRLGVGTNGQFLSSNGSTPTWSTLPSDLFEATYGTTTYSAIETAYVAKKICFVIYSADTYILYNYDSQGISFICPKTNGTSWVAVSSEDVWANGSTTFGSGTVTSVGGTGSGGISVTGGPITSSGTLTVGIDSGYKLPTTTEWGKVVTTTQNNNVTVPGTGAPGGAGATTVVTTYTYDKTRIYTPNGIIIGGTAANSGLVTRGICGINTPDSTGSCAKDNLFLNFDGDTTYRTNRQVVLQAGTTGTHYGSNVYQYCAVRGDALKGWVENKFPNTTTAGKVMLSTTTSGTAKWSDWSTAGVLKTDTSGVVSVGGITSSDIDSTGASGTEVLTANGDGTTSWSAAPSDIYLATYGTTTFAQIGLAILAGQLCGVEYQGDVYIISNASASGYTFSSVSSTGVKTVSLSSSSVWSSQSAQILPVVTSADVGKILTVDSNGNWVAVTMA